MDYFYEEIDNWLLPWIIDNFADEFTKDELDKMAVQAQSHLDYYEVLEVQAGTGSRIQSLLTGENLFLNDISSSRFMTKWDIIRVRCYPWREKYLATGSAAMLPPHSRDYILESMQQFHFDWLTPGQEKELEGIRQTVSDGILTTIHQLDADGNTTGIEFLGDFTIDRYLARLTVNSLELAEYAKTRLPNQLENCINFKRITKAQPQKKSPTSQESLDDATKAKLATQFYQEYYATILDEKIPALNNLTPKQARQDHETLPLLIEWLKVFENRELKNKRSGNVYIDVGKLKKELDVSF